MEKGVSVLGAGSWGTAIAAGLSDKGIPVCLWARREEQAEEMRSSRENADYLPDVHLSEEMMITSDLEVAAVSSRVWVFAVPSQSVRSVASKISGLVGDDHLIVSMAKGIETDTLLTTSGVLREVLQEADPDKIAVLYGPSHAEEVGKGIPTTVVAAASNRDVADQVQKIFMWKTFRVYVNLDLIGTEVAGSVKNVMAIAAGIADGLGGGDNTKAALITRGLHEITRLGMAMGAQRETFGGLAGIGDLVVTCMSQHSRNRYLGEQIGRGKSLETIQSEMKMVAEGVRTTQSVRALAYKLGVDMPITESVYRVLFEGHDPSDELAELMDRSAKREDVIG